MTNPFAPQPATQPEQPQAQPAASNPFAQPQQQAPAPAAPQAYAPAPGNPFAGGVPAQQYAPQAQPAQPQWLAQVAPQQQAPAPAAQVPTGPPPALNVGNLSAAGAPPPSGGKGAKFPDMYGRLVLVFPLSVTRKARNPQYVTAEQRQRGDLDQEQLTATVVVLDDGQVNPATGVGGMTPIAYGGAPHALPPVAHTTSEPLPYVRKAMWITQSKMIEQLRPFLPALGGTPGMVAGRVMKAGPAHNDPWYLQGATEAEMSLAAHYLTLVQGGTYPHPLA